MSARSATSPPPVDTPYVLKSLFSTPYDLTTDLKENETMCQSIAQGGHRCNSHIAQAVSSAAENIDRVIAREEGSANARVRSLDAATSRAVIAVSEADERIGTLEDERRDRTLSEAKRDRAAAAQKRISEANTEAERALKRAATAREALVVSDPSAKPYFLPGTGLDEQGRTQSQEVNSDPELVAARAAVADAEAAIAAFHESPEGRARVQAIADAEAEYERLRKDEERAVFNRLRDDENLPAPLQKEAERAREFGDYDTYIAEVEENARTAYSFMTERLDLSPYRPSPERSAAAAAIREAGRSSTLDALESAHARARTSERDTRAAAIERATQRRRGLKRPSVPISGANHARIDATLNLVQGRARDYRVQASDLPQIAGEADAFFVKQGTKRSEIRDGVEYVYRTNVAPEKHKRYNHSNPLTQVTLVRRGGQWALADVQRLKIFADGYTQRA